MRLSILIPAGAFFVLATAGCSTHSHRVAESIPPMNTGASEARLRELEAETGRQALRLLERRLRIEKLEKQLDEEGRTLAAAIDEVLRVHSGQAAAVSRAAAEAAVAEAEALTGLPEHALARVRRARAELDAGNFGGASFLATQAVPRRGPAEDSEVAADGETPFDAPVPLEVTRHSNFRDGPGTEFRVLKRIEAGTILTGYATKGPWVRCRVPDGTRGWIHESLVEGGAGG